METVFILNPEASSSEQFTELLADATDRTDLRPKTSRHPGHARELTREALEEGVDRLVVVGGDGTINEVVNGLGDDRASVELGILPAGTGNDIARSLDLPLAPRQALEVVLGGGRLRRVDLMRARWKGGEKLALNVINGGYAGELADDITPEMKERFGPLAYLAAAPQAWTDTAPCETLLEWADGTVDLIDAVALIVANGRTLGGGFRISPDNDLSDGQFGVFAIQPGTLLDLAGVATRLASGHLAEHPHVVHRATSRLRATTRPPMSFTVDGERIDEQVTDVEVLPNALRVLVPPPENESSD
jgi:diacylglycerol kinase (ATP)